MEFRNVIISNPAKLFIKHNQLVVEQKEQVAIPIEDICTLMLESPHTTISAHALNTLAVAGVTVLFCDERHLPSAQLFAYHQHSRKNKLLNAQFELQKPIKKRLWQAIIKQKITNQACCLKFLNLQGYDVLQDYATRVFSGDSSHMEAAAAAHYFKCLFGKDFYRGSETVENAALNYGYAIIRAGVARNLVMHGLDPAIGIFHHSDLNAFNLADDVLEPFRPLVDLYVASHLQLFGEELTPKDKRGLFNLTNYLVMENGKKYRAMTAIDITTASVAQSITAGEVGLSLPQLIALEEGAYE